MAENDRLRPSRGDLSAKRHYIESALRYADYSHDFADICAMIDSGQLDFWPGTNSVVITEILSYPKYSALNLFLGAGDVHEIEDAVARAEVFARFAGCDRVVMTGRRGWERSFLTKKADYSAKLVVFEKKF